MPDIFWVSYGVLCAIVVFQTLVLLGLARTVHEARLAPASSDASDGLRGQPVPAFSARSLQGPVVTEQDTASAAMLFVSPDCETCSVTLVELEALMAKTSGRVIVVCRSSEERCAQMLETYAITVPVISDADLSLSRLLHVAAAPTAVLVGADHRIDSYGQPMSPDELETLLRGPEPPDGEPVAVPVILSRNGQEHEPSPMMTLTEEDATNTSSNRRRSS